VRANPQSRIGFRKENVMTWSGWEDLGGVITGGPGVASWSTNRLDCFAKGQDNHMWHKWWNGSAWSGWENLGGMIDGAPAAVSWGPNRIDCFARGMDNAMWHKWWNGSTWSGWENLGGVITSGPGVCSWSANRLDCFVKGQDNHMWHKWWNGSAWSGWEDLGGIIDGAPTAVSWGPNRIDCFARGMDNHMWHKWWNGSAWSGWEDLGGIITSAPTVCSWAANRLDCFAKGQDNHMWHKWWNGSGWSGWEDLRGIIDDAPTAVSWGANRIDCFARGMDNSMWHKWWSLIPTVRLHVKILTNPTVAINTMVDRMREVYATAGINVVVASTENLNLPALNDVDVGQCLLGQTTTEQNQLFNNRNNVGMNDVVAYFVRSTVPPFNGCAAHPAGRPGAVVAQGATQWTLGHEIGHVLGLFHVNDNNRLMTRNGTGNITNPPPDLITSEINTMVGSALTVNV
jgi:hypothetical protein